MKNISWYQLKQTILSLQNQIFHVLTEKLQTALNE